MPLFDLLKFGLYNKMRPIYFFQALRVIKPDSFNMNESYIH